MREIIEDYLGEARYLDECHAIEVGTHAGKYALASDCVEINIGACEGKTALESETEEDNEGYTYLVSMEGLDGYVLDYAGALQLERDCVEITQGDYEGEHARTDDDELCFFGDEVFFHDDACHLGYVWDYRGEIQHEEDCERLTNGRYCDEYAHESECERYGECVWLSHDDCPDHIVWASDEWRDIEDCYYDEDEGEWVYGEEPEREGCILEYHGTPSPCFYGGGSYKIGFEVEKTEIDGCDREGEFVGERPLFCGVETDSSCGVEAITHVYSLDAEGESMFFSHCASSRDWLAEDVDQKCGGHVNLSGENVNLANIRRLAGLIYALYRHRLVNTYSCNDKKLEGDGVKYSAIRMRSHNFAEFRLVSAVKNANQIKWRFRFFRLFADCLAQGRSFRYFLNAARPLLREVYPCPAKRREIRTLARHFDIYLNQGIIHHSIQKFL